ncbi:ABC-2 type transport system permease protein [Nonomuraea maritima]|uniref:Transport permease protein n=1 Tax=Nonomuraea maritima TaxID=683260 RepID=A0A1G9HHX9_9ACTN|nr:ABC transporter permease [Nonomuraea maritima]SDL12570.1 ABC-2 type transport system permease protein [Nonomuraea maritima]
MNPRLHAVRLGLRRGLIEFRHQMTSTQDVFFTVMTTASFVVVLYLQRDATLPGTDLPLAAATLPGMLGMLVPVTSMVGAVGMLSVEREDGTLLRAKAMPQGMVGYLVSRVTSLSLSTVVSVIVMIVAGLFLVDGLTGTGAGGWLTVAWLTLLGLLSSLPLGAIVGSLAANPQAAAGLSMLTVGGLTAVSGIFYPISALAGWMQGVAQIFPLYWLGLGMRSALLPDGAAAAEIGGSWRPVETTLVLVAWAVVGLLAAPPILRRMARRESGSAMQTRRDRAMQRIG